MTVYVYYCIIIVYIASLTSKTLPASFQKMLVRENSNEPSKTVLAEAISICQGTSKLQWVCSYGPFLSLFPLLFCDFLFFCHLFSTQYTVAYTGITPSHRIFGCIFQWRGELKPRPKFIIRLDKGLRWWQGWEQKLESNCFQIPSTKLQSGHLWECIK